MAKHRPFRFGTAVYRARSRAELIDLAHKIEDMGFSVCANADHFEVDQLPPLTTLMTVADNTRTLRVAATVFANDFHHPAVLAREAATLDLLSEGRFEFGIGAGYMGSDYITSGIPFDPPGIRISRMAESVQIVKGLFADGPVNFAGTYYTISDLEGYPKPVQRPHPPIMIAGGGKRMLSLAAREADIVGLLMPAHSGALDLTAVSSVATQIEWVRQAAGGRFDDLELNTLVVAVIVTDQRQSAAEELARDWGSTPEQILSSIHCLIGTVEQMVEDVQSWRERFGISYVLVIPELMDAFAPVVAQLAGT
eukprot:GHVR01103392.1.p1 GENE.GHVR01103392.1~~GHVR01103392.1.p1  ORF type:complete len:309 (-),score=20.54 GHVR01103392.1:165-1091(-)